MLISKKHKMIVFDKLESSNIIQSVPSVIDLGNNIAVPHRVIETNILNSIGYNVPSPVYYYYHWPNGQGFKPLYSQVETVAFLTKHKKAFVLNEIGTGKTLSALWAADYLLSQGAIKKVLVISPLSTLESVWGNTIWLNFLNRKYVVIHGSKAKRLELLKKDVDFYIINPDGAKTIWSELHSRLDIDHMIIDEIAEFRESRSERYKVMASFAKQGKSIWGLTGTPMPKAPTDVWAQCRLISPQNVSPYFNRFRLLTMDKVTTFKWKAKPDALQTVHRAMQPAIRFKRDECFDLPDCSYVDLEVTMSKDQSDAYKEMNNKLKTEYLNGEISAANEGVKRLKLIQIAAGVVYDKDGQARIFPCKDRINTMLDVIRQAGQKVIVFVPFIVMQSLVLKAVKQHWSADMVNGSVSNKARTKIFADFQSKADPHVLVAHPKCMAHGLTLTEASTIIWYAPYDDSEKYVQANGRIQRSPQENKQLIVHLNGSPVEKVIFKRLKNNESTQGTFLELYNQ